jgi:flagellar basal body-associated protein FliL
MASGYIFSHLFYPERIIAIIIIVIIIIIMAFVLRALACFHRNSARSMDYKGSRRSSLDIGQTGHKKRKNRQKKEKQTETNERQRDFHASSRITIHVSNI